MPDTKKYSTKGKIKTVPKDRDGEAQTGSCMYRCWESGDGCILMLEITPMAMNMDSMDEPP